MKKILIISLILIHLFGNSDLVQIFSFPKLLSHFQDHKKTNPDVKFLDFVYMHYIGNDGTDKDDDKDHQLPFNHVSAHTFILLFNTIPDSFEVSPASIEFTDEIYYGSKLDNFNPSSYLSTLFRPPCALS